jgi:endonuclease III related protein
VSTLRGVYDRLYRAHGPLGWWPAQSPLEVCIGAILVQNTGWAGAALAIDALRQRDLLVFERLTALSEDELAELIRPAGTFRVKARRLRALLDYVGRRFGGDVSAMSAQDAATLRAELLQVHGIGRETADCIVLYAAGLPVFVIDAYTRRVFSRLGLVRGDEPYDELQRFAMDRLPLETPLFNDFHAQIVEVGKRFCRARPRCAGCPLEAGCPRSGVVE